MKVNRAGTQISCCMELFAAFKFRLPPLYF